MVLLRFLLICWLAIWCLVGYAQVIDPRFSGRPTEFTPPADTVAYKPPLELMYFLSDNLEDTLQYVDTTLAYYIEQPDPGKSGEQQYVHLGHLGSSAMPLHYDYYVPTGFHKGVRQYELYKFDRDKLKFYNSNRTVADVGFYKLSGGQKNFIARADYFQQFQNNFSLSLNFKRYYFDGLYENAASFNTSFALGILYMPQDTSVRSHLSITNNLISENHNGGITDTLTLFSSPFRNIVPVALQETKTRYEDKAVKYHYEKSIANQLLKAYYDGAYILGYYFYGDNGLLDNTDSLVYKDLITDRRGTRIALRDRTLQNTLSLQSQIHRQLLLKVGLRHDLINIQNSIASSWRNDVTIMFDGSWKAFKVLETKLNGHLGLGSNAGNFLLKASTSIAVNKLGNLDISWSSYLKEVPLMDRLLVNNGVIAYNNDFNKPFGTRLNGQLTIPKLGLDLDLTQDIATNAIYWDEGSLPTQYSAAYTHTALKLASEIRLWKFGLRNTGYFQVFSDNIYRLPQWYSTHDLHIESKPFDRKMTLRLGMNARLIPAGPSIGFQPITGRFYQGANNSVLYPEWGGYISAKIQTFRIGIIYDNITDWFTPLVNTNVNNYPYYDANLSLSLRWLLLD